MLAYLHERVAFFNVPKAIRFVDTLPRSGMGKVLKDELRTAVVEGVRGS